MRNLKLLSIDLGKKYIPIKDRNKKHFISEFVSHEGYDVVMLQGSSVSKNIDLDYLERIGYRIHDSNNKVITLSNYNSYYFSSFLDSDIFNMSVLYYQDNPLVLINVNCKDIKKIDDIYNVCKKYSDFDSEYYVENRVISGRFPREADTNEFCDRFDLDDISSLVAMDYYQKNNREMLNHFFISRTLECRSIHKLVGMSEIAKIGEAYPMEVSLSYKKALK